MWSGAAAALAGVALFVSLERSRGPRRDAPATPVASDGRAGASEHADPGALLDAGDDEDERAPLAAESDAEPSERSSRGKHATLGVKVLATGSDRPLADVEVTVQQRGPRQPEADAKAKVATTDESGRVEIEVRARLMVTVDAAGRTSAVGRAHAFVQPLEPGERRTLELRLDTAEITYFGRVIEREGSAPVAGATIVVTEHGSEAELARASSDGAGAFVLHGVAARHLYFRVDAAGFGPSFGRVEPGHESPARAQVIALDRGAALVGRVVDGRGAPLADVEIRAEYEALELLPAPEHDSPGSPRACTVHTDASGAFLVPDLPVRARIDASIPRESGPPRWQQTLTLAPGERRALEIVLHDDVRLVGRVVDQDARPVVGVELWMKPARDATSEERYFPDMWLDSGPGLRCTSDDDGRFHFEPAAPGAWRVGPAPLDDPRKVPESERVPAIGVRVELRPGTAEHELDLRVERALYIRGRIELTGERPESLFVMTDDRQRNGAIGVYVEDDLTFAAGPLAPGRHGLIAMSDHVQSERVEVDAGAEDVVLRLAARELPSARIRVRCDATEVREGDLTLLSRFGKLVPRNAKVAADGTFEFLGLDTDTYDLFVVTSDGRFGGVAGLVPSADGEPLVEMALEECTTLRVVAPIGAEWVRVRARRDGAIVATSEDVPGGTACVLHVPVGPLVVEAVPIDGWTALPNGEIRARDALAVLGREVEVVIP